MSGDRRRGGKLPKRDEKKGELVTPHSAKGKSPAAGHERRPKHFGDDVGGTALPIPSESLNTVNPDTVTSTDTTSSHPFNTPGAEPLYASHLQGSSMDDADTFCCSQMDEFEVEREFGMVVRKWRRIVHKIDYCPRSGLYWVSFDGGSEGLIMPSFKALLAQLSSDYTAGTFAPPCFMYGRNFAAEDDIEVVTCLRVTATLCPVLMQDVPYTCGLSTVSPSKRAAATEHVVLRMDKGVIMNVNG